MRGGRWLQCCDTQSTEFELRDIAHELVPHAQQLRGKRILVVTEHESATADAATYPDWPLL